MQKDSNIIFKLQIKQNMVSYKYTDETDLDINHCFSLTFFISI